MSICLAEDYIYQPWIDLTNQSAYQIAVQPVSDGKPLETITIFATQSPSGQLRNLTRVPKRLEDYVAYQLSSIATVHGILGGKSGDVFHVWVLMDTWNPQARKAVYAQEKKLIGQFTDEIFDFSLVNCSREINPEEIVTGMPVLWRRR